MRQKSPKPRWRLFTCSQGIIGVLALLLGGCPGMFGGTEVIPTERITRLNNLPKKSITMLAIAPVVLPDRAGDVGDVERATLEAYAQLQRAIQQASGTPPFTVLTPLQFTVARNARMTEHEREADLVHAAKRVGASHVLVIEAGRAEGGEFGIANTMGLTRQQAAMPVSVKILGADAERTLWREDFTVAVKFSVQGVDKIAVRGTIVGMGVARFLETYGL